MTTVEEFAEARYLDPGDVRVTVATLVDLHDDELPRWVVDEVDDILNPWCFRTVPEVWSGVRLTGRRPCRCQQFGGREHGPGLGCPRSGDSGRSDPSGGSGLT